MENESIKLATINTELGTMTITLEDRDASRILVARTEDGATEELLADQPQAGYAAGNQGIVAAMGDVRTWYDARTWNLTELVDWRDYVAL